MNEELYSLVFDRLNDAGLPAEVEAVVLAACEGPEELAKQLGGQRPPSVRSSTASRAPLPGIFLKSLEVQGFRGIGERTTLELLEGPGLTLIVGRNGSGKSSLAEALEYAFTGSNRRWEGRGSQSHWMDGWRNLHFDGSTEIRAHLAVEGSAASRSVVWTWPAGSELRGGRRTMEGDGLGPEPDPDWKDALSSFRPFLSYNELGGMLEGRPVDLYRALCAGLGLEELDEVQEELRKTRLDFSGRVKQAREALQPILRGLAELDDPRAQACLEALRGPRWDLESVETIAAGTSAEHGEEIEMLRRLRAWDGPEPERIEALCGWLRQADRDCRSIAGSEAEKDLAAADLLERALELYESHGDQACPVCGVGALDESWREAGATRVKELRERAERVRVVRSAADGVRREARDYFGTRPSILDQASETLPGIDLRAVGRAYDAWLRKKEIEALEQLAAHIEASGKSLAEALQLVRDGAAAELDRRQSAWQPLARDLAGWLPAARDAVEVEARVPVLETAWKWFKDTTGEIQSRRFRPISSKASQVWSLLRRRSNVDLREICLSGTGSHGRVDLEVTVDGRESAALGVMSQGELFSLALSLFLPRATRPESPFRFLVIDDPVQSMDPVRVDGLARVLEEIAATRQVIVFTHDARLSESVRRLDIEARIVEVIREPDSKVELRPYSDPVARYLEDARALILTENLPDGARRRAVPVLCRMALEAACDEALRRRWMAEGRNYLEVEKALESSPKLFERAALVFSSNRDRPDDVHARLRNIGLWAVETFQKCNRGSHAKLDEDLMALVRNVEKLAEKLRRAR